MFAFFVSALTAFTKPTAYVIDNQNADYKETSIMIDKWSRDKEARKVKGWKHFKRWEWFNESRTLSDSNSNQSIFSTRLPYYYKAQVDKSESLQSDNGWYPRGPNNFLATYDPSMGHGVGRVNCIEFHPTNPDIFWVGTPRGGIWKTNNGGLSWMPIGDDLPMARVSDIACNPTNPDEIYIAIGDYAYISLDATNRVRYNGFGLGIYKTIDGGDTWHPTGLTLNPKFKELSVMMGIVINKENPDRLIAAGSSGIYVSNDAGNTWAETFSNMVWDIKQDPVNQNTLYATTGYLPQLNPTNTAGIYKSIDFGATWQELNTGIPKASDVLRIELAVSPEYPNYVYAIACNLTKGFHSVYKSENAGATWRTTASIKTTTNILEWELGDENKTHGQGDYDLTLIVNPNNKEEVFSGGINCWGSSDGGTTWGMISYWFPLMGTSIHADIHCTKYNPLNKTYYFCTDGGVSKTQELVLADMEQVQSAFANPEANTYTLPTKWDDITAGLAISEFYKIGLSKYNPNYLIGGVQDNGTFYHNSKQWLACIGGDGMESIIDHYNPQIIYGTIYFGDLFKSLDGSKSLYKNGKSLTDTIMKVEKGNWVTPYIMHPSDANTIYAGFGNVWKSTDGADTWTRISDFPVLDQVEAPTPIFSMAVSESNPDMIAIAKRKYPNFNVNSQLLVTENAGQTWSDVSAGLPTELYFNSIAYNSNNPSEILVAISGFDEGQKVYRTKDAGKSWENISWNLPNVPVNAVVHQKSPSIYYIGTDVGVFYTHDLSKEWIEYNKYLPNTVVTDLKIHEVSNKLVAATFGRGVWEINLLDNILSVRDAKKTVNNLKAILTNGKLELSFSEFTGGATLDIVNINGVVVSQKSINFTKGNAELEFDLISGVYFLNLRLENNAQGNANKIYTCKVVNAE